MLIFNYAFAHIDIYAILLILRVLGRYIYAIIEWCLYIFVFMHSSFRVVSIRSLIFNTSSLIINYFCVGRVMEIWDPHVLSKYKGEYTYTLEHCSNITPLLGLLDPPSNDTINGVLGGYARAYLMYILFMSLVDNVVKVTFLPILKDFDMI
jgi:hypothetical protein